MEKFEQFRPAEETIESWLDGFEARLLCHNIQSCETKRNWCQALVGEAGRSIIKKFPVQPLGTRSKKSFVTSWGKLTLKNGP